MDNKITQVAAYTRVSTGKQVREGHGLETQTATIDAYCKAHGWHIAARYSDVYTGTDDNRPGLQNLLGDAPGADFTAVVFYDVSRFSRDTLHLLECTKQLDGHGVGIVSVRDAIDTVNNPAMGKLLLQLLAVIVEWEHTTIKQRMGDARLKLWREGKRYIGRPPVGYVLVDGVLAVCPTYAPVVQRIYSLYLGGLAMGKIGQLLKSEGHKTPAGKWFTSGAVSSILRNQLYTGHTVGNTHYYKDGHVTDKPKPASEHIHVTAPVLVSMDQFSAVQERIKAAKGKVKRAGGLQWAWLRDACRCEVCGGPIRATSGGKLKNGERKKYYTCTWKRQSKRVLEECGRERCTMPLIPAEQLHTLVWGKVMHTVGFYKNRERLKGLVDPGQYRKAIGQAAKVVDNWQKEVTRITTARQNLYSLLENGSMDQATQAEFMGKLNTNQAALTKATASLGQAQAALEDLVKSKDEGEHVLQFLESNGNALKGLAQTVAGFNDAQRYQLVMAMLPGEIGIGEGGRVTLNTLKLQWNQQALTQLLGNRTLHGLCPLTGQKLISLLNLKN